MYSAVQLLQQKFYMTWNSQMGQILVAICVPIVNDSE